MSLECRINEIACNMMACSQRCKGIARNIREGILPRCLILEIKGRIGSKGSVIVGINAGRSKSAERKFYCSNGQNYEQVMEYWQQIISLRSYYIRLRNLVNQLGLNRPILWTELVKCENLSAESGLHFRKS
jgi:hypothetical protein